jgi:hypothetical protein
MQSLRSLVRFLVLGLWVAVAIGAVIAPEKVPTDRDRQVLDALLLRLAVDPKFDVTRVSTHPPTIVLHREAGLKRAYLGIRMMAPRHLQRPSAAPGPITPSFTHC